MGEYQNLKDYYEDFNRFYNRNKNPSFFKCPVCKKKLKKTLGGILCSNHFAITHGNKFDNIFYLFQAKLALRLYPIACKNRTHELYIHSCQGGHEVVCHNCEIEYNAFSIFGAIKGWNKYTNKILNIGN